MWISNMLPMFDSNLFLWHREKAVAV